MRTEGVRRADRGSGRDEGERLVADRHTGRADPLAQVPVPGQGHEAAPERQRPQHGSRNRDRHDPGPHEPGHPLRPATPQPGGAEHGCGKQPGDRRRRVVEPDRGLGGRAREHVHGELRHRGRRRERREQRQAEQRQKQVAEVDEVTRLERRLGHAERVPGGGAHEPERGAADGPVATGERRAARGGVVRHDDGEGEHSRRDPGAGDRGARRAPPVGDRVPDSERRHGQPDLLLRRERERGDEREGEQATLVQQPERRQEERRRERDGMEVVESEPLGRRVEEVDEREAGAGPLAFQVLAGEQEHGKGTERDPDRLRHEQERGVGPQPPERGESGDGWVEMGTESRDLASLEVGDLQELAVGRRPDGLDEVPHVEAPRREAPMLQRRERPQPRGEGADSEAKERPRACHRSSRRSSRARQRPPSTRSLARVS